MAVKIYPTSKGLAMATLLYPPPEYTLLFEGTVYMMLLGNYLSNYLWESFHTFGLQNWKVTLVKRCSTADYFSMSNDELAYIG